MPVLIYDLLIESKLDTRDPILTAYVHDRKESIQDFVGSYAKQWIFNLFDRVITHRLWVENAFHLVTNITDLPVCYWTLLGRVHMHDLSKLSTAELLGFAYKEGRRDVDDPLALTEMNAWEYAVDHHHRVNDHHPEHFDRKTTAMPNQLAFFHSIMDKLGAWLHEEFQGIVDRIPVEKVFAIPDIEGQYSPSDAQMVQVLLEQWALALQEECKEDVVDLNKYLMKKDTILPAPVEFRDSPPLPPPRACSTPSFMYEEEEENDKVKPVLCCFTTRV